MAWFKVDDGFANSKPVLRIPRRYRAQAVGLWVLAGSWSAKEETDGFIPDYVLEELCGTPSIAQQLVKCGLWENVTGTPSERDGNVNETYSNPGLSGWRFRNWGRYQPTKAEQDEKREKERIRKAEYRLSQRDTNGTDAGRTQGHQRASAPPDPARPGPLKEPSSEVADATPRPEVEQLLDLLDQGIEANGAKKPTRTKKNTDAARLLLDRDGWTVEQVSWMIRWATRDEFWRRNILSMSKLREKFDQLKLQSGAGKSVEEINPDKVLGPDYWTPPPAPSGLSIQDEMAWKREQAKAHREERLAEAMRKVSA